MQNVRIPLGEAIRAKDEEAFENALASLYALEEENGGALQRCCDLLIDALPMEWHFRHEDLVQAIQGSRCPDAIEALEGRATKSPVYLEWDDNYALARKCTWALADIGTGGARAALERLATCDISKVRAFAQKRLDRWDAEADRKLDRA